MYSIARHVQKHARLTSVLESMDNGKPIRESRDCDIPLVARHFYHHAGVCVCACAMSDIVFVGLVSLLCVLMYCYTRSECGHNKC